MAEPFRGALPTCVPPHTFATVQPEHEKVARSLLAMAAGVVGLLVDLGYLAIMFDEPERTSGRVAVVFLFILAVSGLALAAVCRSHGLRGRGSSGRDRDRWVAHGWSARHLLHRTSTAHSRRDVYRRVARRRSRGAAPLTGVPLLSTLAAIGSGAALILGIVLT